MRKEKTFVAFGQTYKVKQFSAAEGFEILMGGKALHELPVEDVMRHVQVHVGREWISVNDKDSINKYVKDPVGGMRPIEVLFSVMGIVREHSFAFYDDWRPLSMPKRFLSNENVDYVQATKVHPIMAYLIEKQFATVREMEEYYSLEDAFKMNDEGARQDLNKCLMQEAANKAAEAAAKAAR